MRCCKTSLLLALSLGNWEYIMAKKLTKAQQQLPKNYNGLILHKVIVQDQVGNTLIEE